jgi:hypothetical protein
MSSIAEPTRCLAERPIESIDAGKFVWRDLRTDRRALTPRGDGWKLRVESNILIAVNSDEAPRYARLGDLR